MASSDGRGGRGPAAAPGETEHAPHGPVSSHLGDGRASSPRPTGALCQRAAPAARGGPSARHLGREGLFPRRGTRHVTGTFPDTVGGTSAAGGWREVPGVPAVASSSLVATAQPPRLCPASIDDDDEDSRWGPGGGHHTPQGSGYSKASHPLTTGNSGDAPPRKHVKCPPLENVRSEQAQQVPFSL